MTPTFCFLIGFRNWRTEHLSRSLTSIRRQTDERISVCDLGSEPGTLERVKRICADHDAKLVVQPADVWSRSLALNVAARNAGEVDYLVLCDADCYFASSWKRLAAACARPRRICLTRSRDTDETFDCARLPDMTDQQIYRATTPHPATGMGAGMVVPAQWFFAVRGMEEALAGWGGDDDDIVMRAQWSGLEVGWIDGTWVGHQWHNRMAPPELWAKVEANRAYLAERRDQRGPVIRNPKGWGGIDG